MTAPVATSSEPRTKTTRRRLAPIASALAAAANPYAVFPVILHQTGGSSHYPADWTYTIKDVTDATTLATSVNPTASPHLYRRSSCYLGPATHGLAHMVGSALVLDWIDEIEGEEACITP